MISLPSYIEYRIALYKISRAQKKLDREVPPETQEAYDYGELDDHYRRQEDLYLWKALTLTKYYEKKQIAY